MARIVLLNGTPSSGKTTVATALQEQLSNPYWHLSLDDFLAGYRDNQLHETLFGRTLAGYLPALREMVAAGNDVVAEAVISPGNAARYFELFGEFTVYFVGVRCPLAIAMRREAARSDRLATVDLDTPEFDAVHDNPGYDVATDTSSEPTVDAARRIAAFIETHPRPDAFKRLAD